MAKSSVTSPYLPIAWKGVDRDVTATRGHRREVWPDRATMPKINFLFPRLSKLALSTGSVVGHPVPDSKGEAELQQLSQSALRHNE